jgi:hypothetical protein
MLTARDLLDGKGKVAAAARRAGGSPHLVALAESVAPVMRSELA